MTLLLIGISLGQSSPDSSRVFIYSEWRLYRKLFCLS
jgi:hypothetical protein